MNHSVPLVTEDDYRFERKFLIEEHSFAEVENDVRIHPAMFSEIHNIRQVNNVYFDTVSLNNYLDNVEGQSERLKVRVRWYGASFNTTIEQPVLELKIKHGSLGRKEHYPIPGFTLGHRAWINEISNSLDDTSIPPHVKNLTAIMRPTLINTYKRKYFLSRDGCCRATIDTDMRFYRPDPVHTKVFASHVDSQNTVLELKYDSTEDNTSTRTIANAFRFHITKNSKYVTGMNALYDL